MMEKLPAVQKPYARLILIHGMGDHSRALPYKLFADHFLNRGFEIYRFDLPGHGAMGGKSMYVKNWEELCKPLDRVVSEAGGSNDSIPVFIVGLSLGGLIALNYAAVFPGKPAGVIAASPALDTGGTTLFLQLMLKLLARVMPKQLIDLKLDLQNISRNEQAVKEYTGDKYWQTKTTTGFAASVLEGIKRTQHLAGHLQVPVLILQGGADRIVPVAGGQKFFHNLVMHDKSLKVYPDCYHNLFLEPERELIFDDIANWIMYRVKHAR